MTEKNIFVYKLFLSLNIYNEQAKFNFIFYFLEILQRGCKLVVLGTLGMPGYAHPKWYYQLAENFVFISRQKINFPPHCFSGDTVKIYKLVLGTLGMPGYTQPKWWYQLVEHFNVYLHAKNKVHHSLLPWDTTF